MDPVAIEQKVMHGRGSQVDDSQEELYVWSLDIYYSK